jgi:hypothetical protein
MEQLSISIRKNIDGTWQASAAIGEPGIPHAQAVNASRQPTSLEAVVNLTAAFAVVMPSMHDQLRDFVVEKPRPAEGDEADVR